MFTRTAAFYRAVYAARDYAAEAGQIEALIAAHTLTNATGLLDVACGTGGHLAYLKIARINVSAVHQRVSILDFHYLVGTPAGVEQFTERHELGLVTEAEYPDAAIAAGLETTFIPGTRSGLTGRGLLIGVRPLTDS